MKCEICKQPILKEGYKYVHPICPKGEDAKPTRMCSKCGQYFLQTDVIMADGLRYCHAVCPPKPELTPEEKEWFEGLEYVRPDDPFPFFRFCPCGSISQHLPIAREQVTPIQWIREHYEHRDMKDKLKEGLRALQETLDKIESFRREPVPPELTQEQKDWFEGLPWIQTNPELRECPCGSLLHRNNDAILTHYKHHMEDKVENIRYEDREVAPGVVIPVQVNTPVLSALFFLAGRYIWSVLEADTLPQINRPECEEIDFLLDRGHSSWGKSFDKVRADVNSFVESLGGEKPSVYKQRVPGENKWDVTIKDDEFTLDDRTMKAIEGWHGSKIYVYEPAAYKAEWTDLTHVYCAYASCGVVESQPKDYSVWRLEVKKV